jgi:hypothetical protein
MRTSSYDEQVDRSCMQIKCLTFVEYYGFRIRSVVTGSYSSCAVNPERHFCQHQYSEVENENLAIVDILSINLFSWLDLCILSK